MPMPSNKMIEDPDTYYMLNSIGSMRLSYVGSLLQTWENKTKKGLVLTFPEWVMNEDFVETTKRACKVAGADIVALRKELVATREDLAESRKDIRVLIEATGKDLAEAREERAESKKDIRALIEATGKDLAETKEALAESKKDIRALIEASSKDLAETKEELAESKKDILRLIEVNKDLYQKYEQLQNAPPPPIPPVPFPTGGRLSIDRVRSMLRRFNRENPFAVSNGDARGVTFGGHVKITDLGSLTAFLESRHARKMGLPSDILLTFKVFVLDGKLVTLSDEYHRGVGFSFLWTGKSRKQMVKGGGAGAAAVPLSVGWSTAEAKKYDPRLGIDPATGVKYIDPETGAPWVHPRVNPPPVAEVAVASAAEKKRSGEELSSEQEEKRTKMASLSLPV